MLKSGNSFSVSLGNWQFNILQAILHLTPGQPGPVVLSTGVSFILASSLSLVPRYPVGKHTLLMAMVPLNEN